MTLLHPRRLLAGAALLAGGVSLAVVLSAAGNGQPPAPPAAGKGDHPMFGGTPQRNMADLTGKFAAAQLMPVKEGDKVVKDSDATVKWKETLGSLAYGGPVVAGGKVFVGTNNEYPRNPRDTAKNADGDVTPVDKGILMCFDEATGKFLWQAVHDKLPSGLVNDFPEQGVCSAPVVEGNRVYYVTNRCSVICLDANGPLDGRQGKPLQFVDPATKQMRAYDGPTDADVLWETDMMAELGVFPHNLAACSPVMLGDVLFVVTANGVDEGHRNIPAPEAPSFLAVDKNSGKVLWKRNDPGRRIMHGQWSNPTCAEIGGVKQVIFPGGDGYLYGLVPETGEEIWKCDCNPKEARYELGGAGTRNDFIGTPVVYDGKVYIGLGQDPEHFTGIAHFWCINPAGKKGDISPELGEWEKPGKPNPNSGVVWHYGGADTRPLVPREFVFGRTMSTACIVDDVLYISELSGFLHVLDAKTGKLYWRYDLKGSIWGSPSYVDGKVFLATEGGEVFTFKHDKKPQTIDDLDNPEAKNNKEFTAAMKAKRKKIEEAYLLGKSEFDAATRSTPVVANGVMYVMSAKTLFALEPKKK